MMGKVGKKSEMYIPKKVRELANLNPGDEGLCRRAKGDKEKNSLSL